MRKILLSFGLLTLSLTTFAQLPTFGIRGGVNFAELLTTASGTSITNTTGTLTTYSAGVFADFKSGGVSIQPALNYTGKGGTLTGAPGVSGQFNLHYLQVPVNVVYHVPILVGNFYFGAGPYIAFGANGTTTVNSGSISETDKVTFGGSGEFTTTDVGINGIAGVQFKSGFLIHINYDFGLTNVFNTNGSNSVGSEIKTRTFGVSIGYAF